MDKELVFRAVLSVVGLVLTVAAITRERSGNKIKRAEATRNGEEAVRN